MGKTKEEIAREYGSETIARASTPTIEDYFRTTMRFGLAWDFGWVYTTVNTASGQKYNFCRGYEKTNSTLAMNSRLTENLGALSPYLFKRLFVGMISFDRLPDQEKMRIKSIPARNNFQIEIEPGRIHWLEENGEVDLRLESLGPALWFFNPGAKIKEDAYYTSEQCRVSGKVLGEEVSGFGGIDQAWTPVGMGYIHGKLFLHLEESWMSWANRYEDGSYDYGVAFTGFDRWNCVFYSQNGQKPYVSTENNTFEIKWTKDGVPEEVAIDSGPFQFKWIADARATALKVHMQWATGKMINLARKDLPVESYSTNEYRRRS